MKRRTFVRAAAALAVPLAAHRSEAATLAPADAIARLFTSSSIDPSWFSSLFLSQYTVDRERSLIADILATLGPYQGLEPNGSAYTVRFLRGTVQASASVNAAGAFNFLLFSRMQSPAAAARVAAIFTTSPLPEDWFSSGVLTSEGIVELREIVHTIEMQNGTFQNATPQPDGSYDLAFSKGHVTALIFLGSDGKVESVNFRSPGE